MQRSKDEYIHIDDTWAIGGDKMSVNLYRKRIHGTKGHMVYEVEGYFPNIETLMIRLIDLDINGSVVDGLKYVSDRLADLKKSLHESITSLYEGERDFSDRFYAPFKPLRESRSTAPKKSELPDGIKVVPVKSKPVPRKKRETLGTVDMAKVKKTGKDRTK